MRISLSGVLTVKVVKVYDNGCVNSPMIIPSFGAGRGEWWIGLRCDLGRREEVEVLMFGKSWWISLITLILQAVLAGLETAGTVTVGAMAATVGGMAVVAASHNIGEAMAASAAAKATGTVDVAKTKQGGNGS